MGKVEGKTLKINQAAMTTWGSVATGATLTPYRLKFSRLLMLSTLNHGVKRI